MSRQGISGFFPFFFFFPLFLLNIVSCGPAQVLGHSMREASDFLHKGDTGFILQAELPPDFTQAVVRLKQLEYVHPAAAFYAALLINNTPAAEQNTFSQTETIRSPRDFGILLLCTALDSPSLPARREAAGKLISLVLETGEEREIRNILNFTGSPNMEGKSEPALNTLRSACLYRLGRFNDAEKILSGNTVQADSAASGFTTIGHTGEWNRALGLFAAWKESPPEHLEKYRAGIPAFLFDTLPDEVRRWAFNEVLSSKELSPEELLTPAEITALSNKLVTLPYQVYLDNMRPALPDGGIIFFRYPELLADLGRAYQYTPTRQEEGIKLFIAWDSLVEAAGIPAAGPAPGENSHEDYRELSAFIKTLDSEAIKSRRFMLNYYTGRIERARAEYQSSSDSFRRALMFAPDEHQSDACNWYIIMNTFNRAPSSAAPLIPGAISQWNDVSYFTDILDRISSYLTGKRQWDTLLEIYNSLEKKNNKQASRAGTPLSQDAWILGRAVQEGYIKTDRSAESFFRTAYEEGKDSFYYRAMAASKLGETFAPAEDSQEKGNAKDNDRNDETDFILGFFEYGASSLALPYIREREEILTVPELRKTAEALASSGRWKESLDLVSRYSGREDHEISRQDLCLFYPRPYREQIEKCAGEMDLGEEILYGLIRTESYFMSDIVSRAGAIGLTQLMESTALDMAGRIARRGGIDYRRDSGIDLKDPGVNIHIGSYYLRYLTEQTGSPMLALLAYNGGMGRMRRWLNTDRQQKDGGLSPDLFLETIEYTETREYGRRVLAAAAVYGYLYYGMSMESVAAAMYR